MNILKLKKRQQVNTRKETYYIQWHLLDHCNLKCAHCYQPDAVLKKIDYSNALTVLEKLDNFFDGTDYIPQINLTGGEPLLYPELFELIDEITGRGWKWALLTNGLRLDSQSIEKIKVRKPVFVQVSLEGGKEINDQCRGQGTFEKICHAMELLVAANLKCLVSFTITSKNWRDFPAAASICKEKGVYKLWCDRYVGNDELSLSTEEFSSFLEILAKQRESNTTDTIISAERALMFMAGGGCYHCNAGGSLLIIMPDGTLYPCRRLPLTLGNIFEDKSISEILETSEVWKTLSNKLYSVDCMNCKDFYRCKGGAKCLLYAQTGNLHGRDVNCIK